VRVQTNGVDRLSVGDAALSYNGGTVWHSGNDGAGSALDADQLDGQEGAFYQNLANATGQLGLANGGTGAADAATARGNLGVGLSLAAGAVATLNPVPTTTGSVQVAHGLGAAPNMCLAKLTCLNAEHGYAVGDILDLSASVRNTDSGGAYGGTFFYTNIIDISHDGTNLSVWCEFASNALRIVSKTTGATVEINPANWRLDVTPYKFQA